MYFVTHSHRFNLFKLIKKNSTADIIALKVNHFCHFWQENAWDVIKPRFCDKKWDHREFPAVNRTRDSREVRIQMVILHQLTIIIFLMEKLGYLQINAENVLILIL